MIALSSTARMLTAVRSAHTITFSAYFLHPGAVVSALAAAKERGAQVAVRVDAAPFQETPGMKAATLRALTELRAAGVDARAIKPDARGRGLHLKAAVLDGVAYLDDCNWNTADTVVRDENPAHVRAIRRAMSGQAPDRVGSLVLDKAAALRDEASVLSRAKRVVDVETESVGVSCVSGELRRLATAGVHCRLLVSDQCARDSIEQKRIASLEAAGVQVRAVRANEKLAVCGDRGWVGSADATCAYRSDDYIDWGISTRDPKIVRALRAGFNARWRAAKPVSIGKPQ